MAYSLLTNVMRAIKTHDISYLDKASVSPGGQSIEAAGAIGDDISEGIKNWWYKNTGRAHLTPDYQHEEELADTAYQRAAADMAAAGLSKYGGVSTASSPTPQSGNGLLTTALQMSNLASGIQDLKERSWNYGVSKGLGIRTNDKNPLSGISAIFKLLTGKDLSDFGDGEGIVNAIRDWWSGLSFNKGKNSENFSPDGSDNPSNVLASAATDGVQNVLQDLPTLQPILKKDSIPVRFPNGSVVDFNVPSKQKSADHVVSSINPNVNFSNAATYVIKSMIADYSISSGKMFTVARLLSKRYDLSENYVLDYLFDLWDKYKETEEPGKLNFVKMK